MAIVVLALGLIAAGIISPGFMTPAAAQVGVPTKAEAAAQAAYEKALREFKAILAERRRQIEAKQPLPARPGQAMYLARVEMMSAYKDLTDAVPGPHRAGQQVCHPAGLPRCRQRGTDR